MFIFDKKIQGHFLFHSFAFKNKEKGNFSCLSTLKKFHVRLHMMDNNSERFNDKR